ncbi:hypothetical protein TNCV_4025511 [Trichonephila clavipes]|nr:hypothetical protein TNCV_4025511 [Trichonephila clavipes]
MATGSYLTPTYSRSQNDLTHLQRSSYRCISPINHTGLTRYSGPPVFGHGPRSFEPWSNGKDDALSKLPQHASGYVKSLVYADKPQMLDHLEDNIHRVIADIRPQMLEKVIENWTSRLDFIRASRGSPMPEIIFKM